MTEFFDRLLPEELERVVRFPTRKPSSEPILSMEGFVYIGFESSKMFKIGMTVNPRRRLREIKGTNPTFQLLVVFHTDNCAREESRLHEKYKHARVTGEWFRLTAKEVAGIVGMTTREVKKKVGL